MKKRRICALIILSISLLIAGVNVNAAETEIPRITDHTARVFDFADLMSEEDEGKLQTSIKKVEKHGNFDMLVITTNENESMSAAEYAEAFYRNNGFNTRAGVLYIVDTTDPTPGNREVEVMVFGEFLSRFSVEDQNKVLDKMIPHLREGNYYKASAAYVSFFGRGFIPYYRLVPTPMSFIISAAVAVVILLVFIATHTSMTPGKQKHPIREERYKITNKRDTFKRKSVSSVRLNTDSGGSSGSSGRSGGSSGGASRSVGRKF